jgi:hypothetical protein
MANLGFQISNDIIVSGNYSDGTTTATSFLSNNNGQSSNIQIKINSYTNSPTLTYDTLLGPYLNNLINFIALSVSSTATYSATSTDGITWTTRTMPYFSYWQAVTYGGDIFVAITVNSNAAISTDGITWTLTTNIASTGNWNSIAYGNGVFVTTQSTSTTAASSTNGITWTTRTMPANLNWYGLIYAKNIFVSTNANGTTSAASSTDGITWTLRTLPTSGIYNSIAYGNGIFITTNNNGTNAATSTDGITWTLSTVPSTFRLISYGNNIFVAIGSFSSTAASSTDGVTWTLRTLPVSTYWQGLTYGNGIFLTTSWSTGTTAAISTDGITWTLSTLPVTGQWVGVTSSPYKSLTNSQTIQGLNTNIITVPTYTIGQYDKYINLNTTAACTLTLPNAGTYPNREITIRQIAAFAVTSASSNVVPLTSNTAGTAILSGAGKYATLVSDGYNWIILEAN